MTTPKVGLTHDIVVYPAGGGSPIGYVINPTSYRVSHVPDFIPRVAMGDPRGLDYSGLVSWVQNKWVGRSGLDENDGQGYRLSVGMFPSVPDGVMHVVNAPGKSPITLQSYGAVHWSLVTSPLGVVPPAVSNVFTTLPPLVTNRAWYYSETRVPIGKVIFQPLVSAHPMYVTMQVVNTLDRFMYSAVEFSTVMFVSTYLNTKTVLGEYQWGNIVGHYGATTFAPVGTTVGGALAAYDQKLWRASPLGDSIAYYRPEETTLGYWSGWTAVRPGCEILAMSEFIGRLMIGAADGLYAYESGRAYLVADFKAEESAANFAVLKTVGGALYFNIKTRLFRYTSGGLLEELDASFDSDEIPLDMVEGPGGVFVWAGNIDTGRRTLYRIDISYGSTQQVDTIGQYEDKWATNPHWDDQAVMPSMFRVSMPGSERIPGGMELSPLMVGPVRSSATTGNQFNNYGDPPTVMVKAVSRYQDATPVVRYLETGYIDLGYPKLYKTWVDIKTRWTYPEDDMFLWIGMEYRLDTDPGTWISVGLVGVSSSSKGITEVNFTLGSGVTSRRIELKPVVHIRPDAYTLDVHDEPRCLDPVALAGLEVDALFVGDQLSGRSRREIQCSVVATEPIELLNGEIENSLAYINQATWSLFGTGSIHTVALPYPPPTGHTTKARVELSPQGVVVPILAYSMHQVYNLGSEIPLKITEI